MFSKLCKSRSANQIKLCVCVCLFVCLFISFHRKCFSWQNKINVMSEFRSTMVCCGNISVSSTFISLSKTIIEKTFNLASVKKSVSLTRQSHKKYKRTVKARSIANFFTNLKSCLDWAQKQYCRPNIELRGVALD